MIDPQRRWSRHADGKPDYAGLLTFAGLPYTEDLADLAGVDAAIIGAPMDELVTDRPGTRFGPRAIRAAGAPHGVHLEAGIDAFEELRVVDYGDAACVPADPESSAGPTGDVTAFHTGGGFPETVFGHCVDGHDGGVWCSNGGGPIVRTDALRAGQFRRRPCGRTPRHQVRLRRSRPRRRSGSRWWEARRSTGTSTHARCLQARGSRLRWRLPPGPPRSIR